jgi:hypothetical protein
MQAAQEQTAHFQNSKHDESLLQAGQVRWSHHFLRGATTHIRLGLALTEHHTSMPIGQLHQRPRSFARWMAKR